MLRTLTDVSRSVQTLLGPTLAAVTLDTGWMQMSTLAMVSVHVNISIIITIYKCACDFGVSSSGIALASTGGVSNFFTHKHKRL